jgi:tetratricopeptide (TPR) repeat protein
VICERYVIGEIQGIYYLNRAREFTPEPGHYEEYIEKALGASVSNGQARYELSRVLASERRYEEALIEGKRASRTYSSVGLLKHLGSMYLKNNDTYSARESFEKVIRLYPGEPTSTEALASIYLKEKRLEEGREVLDDAVRLRPGDSNLHYWLGLIERESGNYKRAVEEFGFAVERSKGQRREARFSVGDAYFNIAYIYGFNLGDLGEAIRYAKKAIDTEAKPQYYYYIIQLYEKAGEKAKSKEAYREAIGLFPGNEMLRSLESLVK